MAEPVRETRPQQEVVRETEVVRTGGAGPAWTNPVAAITGVAIVILIVVLLAVLL